MAPKQKSVEAPDVTRSRRDELNTASREYEDRLVTLYDALGDSSGTQLSPEDRAHLRHGVWMLLAHEGIVIEEREQ